MIVIFILILLLALILGGSYYAYRFTFYSSTKGEEYKSNFESPRYDPYREEMSRVYQQLQRHSFKRVSVTAFDGIVLSGRYFHIQDGAPVDIAFHGYRSSPMSDFSGGSELCFSLGHNLLLVDQRAHGQSGDHTISFGIRERMDVLSWVSFVSEKCGSNVPIFLYGISMGGATVLMASELDLPQNVRGIIADCPYSSPKEIICRVASQMKIPVLLAWPFVKLGARIYGGFDICEADSVKAVKHATVPIMILHGEADGFVPCEMSDQVFMANPDKVRRHTFPGADHGFSYLVDTPRYQKIVTNFVNALL